MKTYVLDFESYNEELIQNNWINYKAGTDVYLDKKNSDASIISDKILHIIGAKDASELIFTGSDVASTEDYTFMAGLVEGSHAEQTESLQFQDYTVYISKYTYQEKTLVKVDIKYTEEISYIFMKQEDFDFFSSLAPGGTPQSNEQAAQTAQANIPTASGTGPTPVGSTIA